MKRTVAPAPHLRRAGLVVAIASLAAIGFVTLMPEPGAALGSHWCLLCGPLGGVSSLLNILLFVPLGIGLAISGFPWKRAVIAMCALSVLIETAQLLVIPGRYSTIGDVLTNSLGAALGFAIGRYAFILLRPSRRTAIALTIGWSAVWLAIQTTSAFGFSPAIPQSQYYGQIAPRLGNFEQFRGRVLRATIGDVVVPDAQFENSPHVRELLLGGAIVSATILPPASAGAIAPIVRIADTSQREILVLAQDARDLIFGMRTGASALRLRPPLFALANVLPTAAPADSGLDTLTVSASYSARAVWVNARSKPGYDRRIQLTASLGWTMIMPFQWFIEGTSIELAVAAIWIGCLLLPLGYWGAQIVRLRQTGAATRVGFAVGLIALVLLYVGLVLVPQQFGVTTAPARDWLAALTGLLLGAALGARTSEPETNVAQID